VTVPRSFEAAWWLLLARGCLLFRPGLALTRKRAVAPRAKPRPDTGVRFARAVQRAARHLPFRPTCLEEALALERLLHRAGLDASLVLGVRRAGTTIEAHAWLEHQGHTLLGATGELYTPLHRTRPA